MKMNENLPRPGGNCQRHKQGNIVSAGAQGDQPIDRSSCNRDIKASPERHNCRQGKQGSHRLNVDGGGKISSGKPGETGCHPATGTGQAGSQSELALVQAQLGVGSHSGWAGNQPGGNNHQRKAGGANSQPKNAPPWADFHRFNARRENRRRLREIHCGKIPQRREDCHGDLHKNCATADFQVLAEVRVRFQSTAGENSIVCRSIE